VASEAVIEVRGLTKRFGEVTAVNGLDLDVARGEILGLLGPNGAGKTTTIQMLLGLTTPSAGSIRIFGHDIQKNRRAILQRVNFSSAYVALPSNLTVRENLTIFSRLYGIRRPAERIARALELFGMASALDRVTGGLSSGQITRVNLAKAFLNDPEVLFLDEPTASLDPDIAERVRGTLASIQKERGVAMIYTSHNMREIEILCDRVVFLSRGAKVAEGTPDAVVSGTRSGTLEELFITIARDGEVRDAAKSEADA
jgi:ABC-2 type transport system ATP-binding protein